MGIALVLMIGGAYEKYVKFAVDEIDNRIPLANRRDRFICVFLAAFTSYVGLSM